MVMVPVREAELPLLVIKMSTEPEPVPEDAPGSWIQGLTCTADQAQVPAEALTVIVPLRLPDGTVIDDGEIVNEQEGPPNWVMV
jgi:hypothetical protein